MGWPGTRRRARVLLWAAPLVIAVALRLAWVFSADVEPINDAAFYHQHATDLAEGRGLVHPETGEPTAFVPPAYPVVLGAAYALAWPSTHVGGVLNAMLAGVAVVGVYVLGSRLAGPAAGLGAALILALFPSQVLYVTAIQADHLFAALVPWTLVAALGVRGARPRRNALAVGALLGIAALTAPQAFFLLPALAVVWAWDREWMRAGRAVALAGIAAAVVILPWTVRNAVQLDAFVPLSSKGGVNLWVGNNPDAHGTWMHWDATAAPEDLWSYPADEVAADREYRSRAFDYMRGEPLTTFARWPAKLRHTFEQDYGYVEHFSLSVRDRPLPFDIEGPGLARFANGYYAAVVVLALAALLSRTVGSASLPLAAAALALTLQIVLFFGLDRFHVPLLPLGAVGAASAVTAWWNMMAPNGAARLPWARDSLALDRPSA